MSKKKNPLDERMKLLEKARKKGKLYKETDSEAPKKKKKEKKMSQEQQYLWTLMTFQFHLYEVICMVNGIDKDIYLDAEAGDLHRNMKFDETFRAMSRLEWDVPKPIDGLMFRGRFLTVLLLEIVSKTNKRIKKACLAITGEKGYKVRNTMLRKWMEYVESFIITYLSSDGDYRKWLIAIEGFLMIDSEIDVPEFMKALVETGDTVLNNEEAGICAANMTRAAYVLATHGAKVKKCPKYDEDYDYRDELGTANQVGGLGYAIIRYRKKENAKVPILYDAFQKANPQIVSRFYNKNEDKPELSIGLRALEFTKIFFSQETRNKKLVEKIM